MSVWLKNNNCSLKTIHKHLDSYFKPLTCVSSFVTFTLYVEVLHQEKNVRFQKEGCVSDMLFSAEDDNEPQKKT